MKYKGKWICYVAQQPSEALEKECAVASAVQRTSLQSHYSDCSVVKEQCNFVTH